MPSPGQQAGTWCRLAGLSGKCVVLPLDWDHAGTFPSECVRGERGGAPACTLRPTSLPGTGSGLHRWVSLCSSPRNLPGRRGHRMFPNREQPFRYSSPRGIVKQRVRTEPSGMAVFPACPLQRGPSSVPCVDTVPRACEPVSISTSLKGWLAPAS